MYAVVQSGGHQFKVSEGDTFHVQRINGDVGSTVELPVLLVGGEAGLKVGAPLVEGAKVVAEIVAHELGEKRDTFKFRHTRQYRWSKGFRPSETVITIKQISA
jgi:large subunit ribosomal protein L21